MDSQYEQVVAALVDLLSEGGFESVSVRHVAARAGVSIGSVQHHFPTKDLMLEAATDRLGAAFMDRLHAALSGAGAPEDRLRAAVLALVNPDPAHRQLSVLWTLRMARAAVHEPTARRHRYDRGRVEQLVAGLIAEARPSLAEARAHDWAAALLALCDGLACAIVVEPARMPAERAVTLVDSAVQAALDSEP